MIFVDATVFIKWVTASRKALDFNSAVSGYILYKISRGEPALTTTLVKDEVLVWLSRYRASRLDVFLQSLRSLVSLRIMAPTVEHEETAVRMLGKYPLGISDLINLAVMKSYDVSQVYSADKGFDEVPWVERIFEELGREDMFRVFLEMLRRKGIRISFRLSK